jgi:3'-phosphoadenosine 5'-phosphosulfate sulfotransferase (PAPS reductase)/FAD synthetase
MLSSITKIGRALATEPVLIMFSGGKDSIVTLDLALKHLPKENIKIIHYYFVPGLSIKERVLTWYESKYGIKIHRVPDKETIALQTGRRSFTQGKQEESLRQQFEAKWIMNGIRKADSLARRGMLASAEGGIDERNGKLYPIGEWSTKQVMSYIKLNRLMLPVEYNMGMERDFYIPNQQGMLWLKNNFPCDYAKVIQTFPKLEAMAKKVEFYGR